MEKVRKSRTKSFRQLLIERLLHHIDNKDTVKWTAEMKILSKLYETYPDEKFWNNVDRKVNSLAHFLTVEGQQYLREVHNTINFEHERPKVFKLEKEKVSEDLPDKQRVLTIKEFLNKYK